MSKSFDKVSLVGGVLLATLGMYQVGCFPFSAGTCEHCDAESPSTTGTMSGGGTTTSTTTSSMGPGGAGPGGMGGAGGQGGAGGAGGGTPVLSDMGLIARYRINEAASGQAEMQLADSAGAPLPLTIDYAGLNENAISFVEEGGHRGLQWGEEDLDAKASTAINPDTNKLFSLEGKTQATIEAVVKVLGTIQDGASILSMSRNQATAEQRFALVARQGDGVEGLELQWKGAANTSAPVAGAWDADLSTRSVVHLVLDTNADPAVLLYVNGVAQTARTDSVSFPTRAVQAPTTGEMIDLASGPMEELVLGNRALGSQSLHGTLFYAALYDVAFPEARVQDHATVLLANDDAP